MASGTRVHSSLLAHVGPELVYGANNNLGLSHIQRWTGKMLSGAPLALPALFCRLWSPIDPDSHSTFAAQNSSAEPEVPKRKIVGASIARYEEFVHSTVLSPASTTAHAISAILQYEELPGMFGTCPSLKTGLLARGLGVAIRASLQARSHSSSMTSVDKSEDILFAAFSQYDSVWESKEIAPVFDVVSCRHSITAVANALIKLEPARACDLFSSLEPLLISAAVSQQRYAAMGSCVATAAVIASIRAQRAALRDPTVKIRSEAGLRREAFSFNFHAILNMALQLDGKERISRQLYKEMAAAAIIYDLRRWQKMRTARFGVRSASWLSMDPPTAQEHAFKLDSPGIYRPTDSPVHFVAHDKKSALKLLRASQAHDLHKAQQLTSSLHACQMLSLTQTAAEVRRLVHSFVFIGKDGWEGAQWVSTTSDEVVCAVVGRLVHHEAWDSALRVLRATLTGDEVTAGSVKVDKNELTYEPQDPDKMLHFVLHHSSETAVMGQRRSRVVNVMLQSTLATLAQQHRERVTPLYAAHYLSGTLHLLQEHNLPLCKHTAKQLMLASSAICRNPVQGLAALKNAMVHDSALQLLGWRTMFQGMLLNGDDGSAILEACEQMATEELINTDQCSESAVVAASYSLMRSTDMVLSDRLLKLESEELPRHIARAIISGFFHHACWLNDVCSHGLLEINSLLLSAGLPFGRHLQLQLAQRKYEAACGLLSLHVPGADDLVHKCGLERLLIADQVFARGLSGRKCIARLAASDEVSAKALSSDALTSGMMDLIPYLSDGYVVSVGHATQPMLMEDMHDIARSINARPRGKKHDLLSSLDLDLDPAAQDVEQVAPLLQDCRAGRVRTPDWLQVHNAHRQKSDVDEIGDEAGWQPEHFSKLGLCPKPDHSRVVGYADEHKLVKAIEQLLTVQRMIQAVPPE